jgi:hypothetical protein
MIAKTNPVGLTTTTLTLPAHWASYLINGDADTMDDTEACIASECEKLYGACVDCSDEPTFCRYHDATADGVLAGVCLAFTFIQHEDQNHE